MKLRVEGNSVRLRVSRSELARFVKSGLLEETVCFGREPGAELTYLLLSEDARDAVGVESAASRLAVILPGRMVRQWSNTEQVGISAEIDLGTRGLLAVLIEKDFACLDRGVEENADTFPNPLASHVC